MALCVLGATKALTLAASAFTLSWTHSVEKIEWRETWAVSDTALSLTEARVKGSGAGMEPGEDARLKGDWWVWTPSLAPVDHLLLAASGATVSAWELCADGTCHALGAVAGAPIELRPCRQ